jgi:hypothetical protein
MLTYSDVCSGRVAHAQLQKLQKKADDSPMGSMKPRQSDETDALNIDASQASEPLDHRAKPSVFVLLY